MYGPRHILITGASSGIGAALAREYAAPGTRLSLHGRDRARLEAVAAEADTRGAHVVIHTGDVADARDMAEWIAGCDADMPVELAIANAGISAGTSGGGESASQAGAVFSVNLGGVLNTVQPLLAPMALRGRGQIALISSLAGFRGFPGAPAYCASKAAVRVYGEGLRGEMARHRVEINVVCPGFVKTPMTDTNRFAMPMLMTAEQAARIIRKGLLRNRARIAFPLPMYLLVRLLAALPQALSDRMLAASPRK